MVDRNTPEHDGTFDCLIVGGGSAGLLAATYLGRFRRRVIVIDAIKAAQKWISLTHNCPGFPDGITGADLLQRLRQQAVQYGAAADQEALARSTTEEKQRRGGCRRFFFLGFHAASFADPILLMALLIERSLSSS